MKFGVMHVFPADGSDRDVLPDTTDDVRLADEVGFDSVGMAEHHFARYGLLGNPPMLGSVFAERTTNVPLGSAVQVLPFHDAVRLAEDANLLHIPRSLDPKVARRSRERFASEGVPRCATRS